MQRVASLYGPYDDGQTLFPHLYVRDIAKMKGIIGKLESYPDDEKMQDMALLLTRFMDWVVAESNLVVHNVRIVAQRDQETDDVIAVHMDSGATGSGATIIEALLDLSDRLAEIYETVSELDPNDYSSERWEENFLAWVDNFPLLGSESVTDENE